MRHSPSKSSLDYSYLLLEKKISRLVLKMCKSVVLEEAQTLSQAEFLIPQPEWRWALLHPPGAEESKLLVQRAPLEAGSLRPHRECCGTAAPLRLGFQKSSLK